MRLIPITAAIPVIAIAAVVSRCVHDRRSHIHRRICRLGLHINRLRRVINRRRGVITRYADPDTD